MEHAFLSVLMSVFAGGMLIGFAVGLRIGIKKGKELRNEQLRKRLADEQNANLWLEQELTRVMPDCETERKYEKFLDWANKQTNMNVCTIKEGKLFVN